MCRRNQLLWVALGAFGLGLLVAGLFESTVLCGCFGMGCIVVSIILLQRK